MKAKIIFSHTAPNDEVIDLTDYGYDENVQWDDLTYEQQTEITTNIASQYLVIASGENYED